MRTGYWWECDHDPAHSFDFVVVAGTEIAAYLQDLARSGWNQGRLAPPCPSCPGTGRVGITYAFPRRDAEMLHVRRIVGLEEYAPDYLPMMWETMAVGASEPWFDFKYIRRNSPHGLMKPAVFSRADLTSIFLKYSHLAALPAFP